MNSTPPIEILLADDDTDDGMLFREGVSDALDNARLTWVEDGELLLTYLANDVSYHPDIIFLDINMPRRCGKECLKAIRANKKLKDVPVVMFSTSLAEKDIDDTFDGGANLYLCKRMYFENDIAILKQIFNGEWRDRLKKRTRKNFVVANTLFYAGN
jgi:DNA-binding NarL/FixJ family response regulator